MNLTSRLMLPTPANFSKINVQKYLKTAIIISPLLLILSLKQSSTLGVVSLLALHVVFLIIHYWQIARLSLQFTRQVGHDIRSPVSTLKMITAKRTPLEPDELRLLRLATARIEAIAGQLLESHQVKSVSDCPPANREIFDLRELVEQISHQVKASHSAPYIQLTLKLPDCPALVMADKSALERVFSNILNNSYEALESHGVIRCGLIILSGIVQLEVYDNGPGISEESRQVIGKYPITKGKNNGHGLGLFYSKNTIEEHGGRLEIESDGTTHTKVVVLLPTCHR